MNALQRCVEIHCQRDSNPVLYDPKSGVLTPRPPECFPMYLDKQALANSVDPDQRLHSVLSDQSTWRLHKFHSLYCNVLLFNGLRI